MTPPATGTLGRPRLHLRRIDSTNTRARRLAAAGAPHGTLVTAGEQTAGRGRQGRSWSAPPGRALLCSLVIREPPPLLALSAGLAVADVADIAGAAGAAGRPAALKWPNDVLIDGRKVAGILVEARPQERWAVLGIGVNVAVSLDELPPELHATAGTLGRAPGDVEPLLAELLAALQRRLAQPSDEVVAQFARRDALRGQAVAWTGGRGRADGVDAGGRLLVVADGGGRTALSAGEVHLLTQ